MPLRILYHHRTGSNDGQAVHIEELVGALRAMGVEVVVVDPPFVGSAGFGGESRLSGRLRRALPRALYELAELAYNVPVYLRLRRAYLQHRPDALYERHNLYLLAGAWLKRRFGVPYLLEVNAPLAEERGAHGGLALPAAAQATESWVWRTADVVLPVTQVLARHVAAQGVPPDRIAVIPNGIDPERFRAAPARDTAKRSLGLEGRVVLGFSGFVRPWHGLDRVIAFLARPEAAACTLLVVGDGPARAPLEAQARHLGVADRLRFTGVVPREEVPAHLAAFDIALQPAATTYASPLKLFEYMAIGCAIVAPAQPNLLEVLRDGEDALLFDEAQPDALQEALARLVGDTALRERLGAGARRTLAARGYTWHNNAQRVAALAATARTDALSPTVSREGT
jgi:glycosyltransferase involved in cell wall biosynthesis